MKDLGGLMKQAQAMQQKLAEAQDRLKALEIEGTSGGGMVKVTLTGAGELKGVVLDESLLAPGEGEVIADLLVAAHADAKRKLDAQQAELMREAGEPVLAGADAVVPVPLHPWRATQRGFNQADDLARALGLPVWRVLARTRHGPPQAELPAARRHANVRRAYRLRTPLFVPPIGVWLNGFAARQLRNRVVVLVDDVMTTGATLDACSRVLRDAGVRSVRALTVARAVARPPGSLQRPPRRDSVRR